MKTNKIYRMFFNLMLAEIKSLKQFDIDDNFVALTDGCRAFKLLINDIPLNMNKINSIMSDSLPKIELTENHINLERTSDLRDVSYGRRKIYARKYRCEEFDVWLNESYVDVFENPTFYGTGALYLVVVCEMGKAQGLLLPIRIRL